jgi:hypothetical protein
MGGKLCARHFYEPHFGSQASCHLVDPVSEAAPELLGACSQALGFVESWEKIEQAREPTPTRQRLEAAIAQVTGKAA